jgi:hypothetical protein
MPANHLIALNSPALSINRCEHEVLVDGVDDAHVTVLERFLYVGYMSFVLFLHID